MTEVLTFDGKTYHKAVQAAETVGYTPDYVGQLCRGGKVDARLIGRTWYVEETALDDHKRNKTRSNKKKTLESLSDEQETEDKEYGTYTGWHSTAAYETPAYRKRLLETAITYSADTTSSLPELRKSGSSETLNDPIRLVSKPKNNTEKVSEFDTETEESQTESETKNETENDEQHTVPIRTVAEQGSKRRESARQNTRESGSRRAETTAPARKAHPQRGLKGRTSVAKQEASTHVAFTHSIQSTVLDALPTAMALLSLTLFIMIVFLQHVWVYDTANGRETAFDTTFNVAAVQSVLDDLRR